MTPKCCYLCGELFSLTSPDNYKEHWDRNACPSCNEAEDAAGEVAAEDDGEYRYREYGGN